MKIKRKIMCLEDFKRVIDQIKKISIRISLYDAGEPLLNAHIYDMIKYVSDNKISSSISTNFTLFSKSHLNQLFNCKLTVLEPCLDGYTQESYEKYRIGGSVEAGKSGIELVMREKIKTKAKWPIVDVQVILFEHLKDEIPFIDDFLHKCHVDKITYRKDNCAFGSSQTHDSNDDNPSISTCFWLYIGMIIRPDGNVYPCSSCGYKFPYGNIYDQNISELWNNKYYKFSRSLFKRGSYLECNEELQNIPCIKCNKFK